MPVEILSMTHDLTTLLFGIYISAFFLGVRQNYKNTGILFLFFCGEGLTYLLFSLTISDPFARQIYPLIVHLPLAIFLFLYYKSHQSQNFLNFCSPALPRYFLLTYAVR